MKRFYSLFIFTILFALVLSLFQSQWDKNFLLINTRNLAFNATAYVTGFVSGLQRGVSNTVGHWVQLNQAAKRAEQVQAENDALKVSMAQFESLVIENQQLRETLEFRKRIPGKWKRIAAEATGRGTDTWFETIIINKGRAEGVAVDDGVINPQGMVGRIIESQPHWSKVMLIINQQSNISAQVLPSAEEGIIQGSGMNNLLLKYIPHNAVIDNGAHVYTSGISTVFPKGILIGTIEKVLKKKYDHLQYIEVKPAVNFSNIEKVWVISNPL